MKSLKTLFALGVAMAVSSTSFAETTNPLKAMKDSAKSMMTEQVSSVKDGAKSAMQETVTNAKSTAVESVMKGKDVSQTARDVLNSAKSTATEKATTVKENAKKAASDSVKKVKETAKVNINKADAKTLQKLSGIGEAKAKAIIDYRNKVGKIKNMAELSKISGLGQSTLDKIAPFLSF